MVGGGRQEAASEDLRPRRDGSLFIYAFPPVDSKHMMPMHGHNVMEPCGDFGHRQCRIAKARLELAGGVFSFWPLSLLHSLLLLSPPPTPTPLSTMRADSTGHFLDFLGKCPEAELKVRGAFLLRLPPRQPGKTQKGRPLTRLRHLRLCPPGHPIQIPSQSARCDKPPGCLRLVAGTPNPPWASPGWI